MIITTRTLMARFRRDRRGSIAVLAALTLPVLIGFVGLVAEFGYGLLLKAENQRLADLAAFSGALAYNSTSSTSTMNAAISNIATLNGVTSSAVTGSLVSSPSGNGKQAVSIAVARQTLLLLVPVIRSGSQLPVSSAAAVEFSAQASGCIIALSGTGTGVTLTGGTSVSAPGCSVQSNTAVSVPCGTTITTKIVDYYSTAAPSQPCNGIVPPSGTSSVSIQRKSTTDPLAGNAGIAAATARIGTASSIASPAAPTVPAGSNIDFAYSTSSTQAQATSIGCSAAVSGSTWTLTCPSGGTYKFGSVTLGGGITVNFNTTGSAATTYDFSGSISNTGTALRFGPGIYNVKQGLTTGGGTTTSFGAGSFNIGTGTAACNGGGRFSICNTGTTLTFGGPSTFVLQGGIYNAGGATITLGSGTTNSFQIGAGSTGDAIYLGGGSIATFADALGGSSVFTLAGNLDVASGGGSCLTLSAAAQHDINGNFATAGGTVLGAGTYTVDGYVGLGINGGGDVTCGGSTVGVSGAGVTFVITGTATPSSGTCAGMSFCVASGYGHVTLTAPTSGTSANLLVIGPTSASITAGALFAEGASTSLSGVFYFPNGPIALSGGASVGSGASQCLQLIGSQISLSGGTTAASTCIASTSAAATTVLVQ